MIRKLLLWLFSTVMLAGVALGAAFALGFLFAVAALHAAFFIALGLIAVGLLAMGRGGGHRMSYGDAGIPEEGAHDAVEPEREMRSIQTEGAGGSVLGNRVAVLSFRSSAFVGAGAMLLLICILFG